MARAMQTFDVPGVAVAVVHNGDVVLAKGYGVRRIGEPPKSRLRARLPAPQAFDDAHSYRTTGNST